MNDDDYVTYEIAVKLKELGFDWESAAYYHSGFSDEDDVFLYRDNFIGDHNHRGNPRVYSAPTMARAQKWLRERGLCVSVYPSPFSEDIDGEYAYKVYQFMDYEEWNDPSAEYAKDYNSALSAGIEAALKLIENDITNSDN